MSLPDATPQALLDAQLLLRDFIASPWRSLSVASGELHLSVSRMSRAEGDPASVVRSPATLEDRQAMSLTAPHVATLRSVAQAGSSLRAGEVYATIEILEDIIDLRAPGNMSILSVLKAGQDVLEYDQPIVEVLLTA